MCVYNSVCVCIFRFIADLIYIMYFGLDSYSIYYFNNLLYVDVSAIYAVR